MKTWLTLTSLLLTTGFSLAQMPARITWTEDSTQRSARGEKVLTCSVNSTDGANWRSEFTNAQADLSVSVCQNGKVTSTDKSTTSTTSSAVTNVLDIYDAIASRAKFEMVDIIGGVGYSRYRETASAYSRILWIDRTNGFPRRARTTFSDGSSREQDFRVINVDPSTQRRLFDSNALSPFFAHYLDEWFERVSK